VQTARCAARVKGTHLRLDRSNGQTEGQINRFKTLKRQMHGRAGLAPLERRFPLAA
jgi:transposase